MYNEYGLTEEQLDLKAFAREFAEKELKEVAKEVKDTLEIVPVKDVETLLKAAGAVL